MLLLLAGTTEARELARRLAARKLPAIATLAGATRAPERLDLPTVVGGFGGRAGFESFLERHRVSAIVDATHPFATAITRRTARIAARRRLPYLHLLRPEWKPQAGDNWIMVADETGVARHVRPGWTLFLATGRQSLPAFSGLESCYLICRRIDRPRAAFPYANGEYLVGRAPFSVEEEIALFRARRVDALVVRNAGGTGSFPKLAAARRLGLPVIMIARQPLPEGIAHVASVEAAMRWIEAQQ